MNKQKLFLWLVFLGLISFSCDITDSPPPEVKPPGYQENILWPSLSDSPWPMVHHDPQSTGRSNLGRPITGSIKWEYTDQYEVNTGVAISSDSIIYTVAGGLLALDNNGEKNG